jgi:hypothetical protein
MYSNFLTPPDRVRTVLLVNATEEQIKDCYAYVKEAVVPYNVYVYNDEMADVEWYEYAQQVADVVLNGQELQNPAEHFDK